MTNYSCNQTGASYNTGYYANSNSPSSCYKTPNQANQCCENSQSLQNKCNQYQKQICSRPRNGLYYYVSPTFNQTGNNEPYSCEEKKTKYECGPKRKYQRFSATQDYSSVPTQDYPSVKYPKLNACLQQCQTYRGKPNEGPRNCTQDNSKKVTNDNKNNSGNKEGKVKEHSNILATCATEMCEIPCKKIISSKCCKKMLDQKKDESTTADYCNVLTCEKDKVTPKTSRANEPTNTTEDEGSLPDCCKDSTSNKKSESSKDDKSTQLLERRKDNTKALLSGEKIKTTCSKQTCPKLRKYKRNGTQTSSEAVLDNTEYNESFSDCCRNSISNMALEQKSEWSQRTNCLSNNSNYNTDNPCYISGNKRKSPDCCSNDIYNSSFKRDVSRVKDITTRRPKALSASNIFDICKQDWNKLGNNKISKLAYSRETILLELTKKQSQEKGLNVIVFPTSYTERENQVDDVTLDNNTSQVRVEYTSRENVEYLNSDEQVSVKMVDVKIEGLFTRENNGESLILAVSESQDGNDNKAKKDSGTQWLVQEITDDKNGVITRSGSSRNKIESELDGNKKPDKTSSALDSDTGSRSCDKTKACIGSGSSKTENISKQAEEKKINKEELDEKKCPDEKKCSDEKLLLSDRGTDPHIFDKKKEDITSGNKNKPAGIKCTDNKLVSECCSDTFLLAKIDKEWLSSPLVKNEPKPDTHDRKSVEIDYGAVRESKIQTGVNPNSLPCNQKTGSIRPVFTKNENTIQYDTKKPFLKSSLKPDCCATNSHGRNSSSNLAENKSKIKRESCCKKPTNRVSKSDNNNNKRPIDQNPSLPTPLPQVTAKWLSCCKSPKCPINDPTTSTYKFLLKTRLCCNQKECKLAAQICDMYEPKDLKMDFSKMENFGDVEYHFLATDAGTAYEEMSIETKKSSSYQPKIINEPTIAYVSTVGYLPKIDYSSNLDHELKPEGERKIEYPAEKKIESSAVEMFTNDGFNDINRESVYIIPEDSGEMSVTTNASADDKDVSAQSKTSRETRVSMVSWNVPAPQTNLIESAKQPQIDVSVSTAEVITQATAEADKFRQMPQQNFIFTEINIPKEPIMSRLSSADMLDDVIMKSTLTADSSGSDTKKRSNCWKFIKQKIDKRKKRKGSQGSDGSGTLSSWGSSGRSSLESDGRKRVSINPVEEKQQQLNNMLNNL